MTRVLEFVVALIIVFVLAVIVALFLPSHAHIDRSIEISHNPRHIYDVLNNFRRFPDYAGGELKLHDPNVKFTLSGPAYGPGATISWTGNADIGNGKLVNESGNIDISNRSTVVWDLTNDWRGKNKTFTIDVVPNQSQRVSRVTWSYDVDYGWNLIDRYSQLWIHGKPAALIQYGLESLQTMLAGINNVDYSKIGAGLYRTNATPVLLVSTKAERTIDDIDAAKVEGRKKIQAAMDKLGVKAAGPTTYITTNYGDTTYTFDVAVPIDTTTLTIDKKSYDLTRLPPRPTVAQLATEPEPAAAGTAAAASTAAGAASASTAGQPASASTAGQAATGPEQGPKAGSEPGDLNRLNQLIVNDDVRAVMLPAQEVLEASWTGEAGVPLMRKALQAYAATHGYDYDVGDHRMFQELVSMPGVQDQEREYRVFLPVQNAPAQTPEQASGQAEPLKPLDPALWNGESESSGGKGSSDKNKH